MSREEDTVRALANKRSWLCPGCGVALIGRRGLAITTFGANLSVVLALVWLSLQPGGLSGLVTLISIVAASVLWVLEQIAVRKWSLRSPSPLLLASGMTFPLCAFWAALVVGAGVLLASFGSLQMTGAGMSPTIEPGEVIIYHKRSTPPGCSAGQLVIYRNPDASGWGKPGTLVVSRILASAGDELSMEGGAYLVNGEPRVQVAPVGTLPIVVDIPEAPEAVRVPEGHFFVVQDKPFISYDSRVLSWIPMENVVGSRFWYLSGRGWFMPVE